MDPREFMAKLYRNLLEQGWTMGDIDSMDIMYYLYLLRHGTDPTIYIDEIL